jgi:hypothetical protein
VHRFNFVQVLDSITEKMFDGPQPENPTERLKILRDRWGPDQRERTVRILLCNAALCLALNVSEVSGYYSVSDRRNSHVTLVACHRDLETTVEDSNCRFPHLNNPKDPMVLGLMKYNIYFVQGKCLQLPSSLYLLPPQRLIKGIIPFTPVIKMGIVCLMVHG